MDLLTRMPWYGALGENFVRVAVVALADTVSRVLVAEEVVRRTDQVLAVGEVELHLSARPLSEVGRARGSSRAR